MSLFKTRICSTTGDWSLSIDVMAQGNVVQQNFGHDGRIGNRHGRSDRTWICRTAGYLGVGTTANWNIIQHDPVRDDSVGDRHRRSNRTLSHDRLAASTTASRVGHGRRRVDGWPWNWIDELYPVRRRGYVVECLEVLFVGELERRLGGARLG